jgi:hypothetical protein
MTDEERGPVVGHNPQPYYIMASVFKACDLRGMTVL